jgi:hypothetical protein
MEVRNIVLTREDHGDKLFEVMGELLKILTNSGYVCKVRADEPGIGIYVIEFDYDNSEMAKYELVWIDIEKQYIQDIEKE